MQRMKSIFSLICILSWPDLDVFLQDDGLVLGAQLKLILYDFLVTVKAAPHECVIRTGQIRHR